MNYEQRDDGVYAYNPVTDTYRKVSDTVPSTPAERNAAQAKEYMREKEAKEAIERAREATIASYEHADDVAARISARERQMALDEQRELDAQRAKWEENRRRYEAVVAARKRYREKSSLYRFFHKSFDSSVIGKTTEQINELYGGIEENKGRSR